MQHSPVLLNEVIRYLDPKPGEFFIDGTVDGGGHAKEICKKILPKGIFLGLDWDDQMAETAKKRITLDLGLSESAEKKLLIGAGNYADIPEILKELSLGKADGLLLDLGFSSEQLESGRGFSFSKDEPLLMTYGKESTSVKDILRKISEVELATIIFELSGEKYARKIAKAIKEKGRKKVIATTKELREAILKGVPANYERGRIDPATRTFQALRIYANEELENLKKTLESLREIIEPGGRVAVITFHSLEDAIVKNVFRDLGKSGEADLLTKKPIEPDGKEKIENPRSRSAKLRAIRMRGELSTI